MITTNIKSALAALDAAKADRAPVRARLAQQRADLASLLTDVETRRQAIATAQEAYDRADDSNVDALQAALNSAKNRLRNRERDAAAVERAIAETTTELKSIDAITKEPKGKDVAVDAAIDAVIRLEAQEKVADFRRQLPQWRQVCAELVCYVGDELHTPLPMMGGAHDYGRIAGGILTAINDEMNAPRNRPVPETGPEFHRRRRAELGQDTPDAQAVA